jgi:transcriptional regulator with XRE-family HTH domain
MAQMLTNQLAELWQESLQDEDFRFELKAQEVAVALAAIVAKTGMTQKDLADKLGWMPSRVSKILHGSTNLTLKTLFQLCEAVETDFDIQFGSVSDLKKELEIVEVKHKQVDSMLNLLWQKKQDAIPAMDIAINKRSQVYELVG